MTKTELENRTDACIAVTRAALQALWDCVNRGQRKQLYKRAEIKTLLDRFGVNVEE